MKWPEMYRKETVPRIKLLAFRPRAITRKEMNKAHLLVVN